MTSDNFPGPVLHQCSPATHVRAATGNKTDGGHTAGNRDLELVVVWNDLIPVPQLGIGLVNHFIQVTRATNVRVGFDQARHGERISVINYRITFRNPISRVLPRASILPSETRIVPPTIGLPAEVIILPT